ncbi:MAG: glutamate-cysteine ligase family protein [Peptoniphilaceae bacterium]|nr:glutamate-cysteine ligase family protein [Peptoniphilaceae bacterium]MDY6085741.1 glutamate-cysteine ligase family protein [Peptoniphilaceae bacterium]
MSLFQSHEEKRRLITNRIRAGYKDRIRWMLGPEIEHLVIDAEGHRVMYPGDDGVEGVMERLSALHPDWTVTATDGHIIGLEGPTNAITLEPGAQLEFSLPPATQVTTLLAAYRHAVDEVYEVLDARGLRLVTLGLDPQNPVDAIPLIPKTRYALMDQHMGARGALSRTMMRQSCAFQLSIDVGSDADFITKYRVLVALSPILYTLFDSAVDFEGKQLLHHNFRQDVWTHTDPARSGFPSTVFDDDFSVEKYADWVLGVPPIFYESGGDVVRTGDRTLADVLDDARSPEEAEALVRHGMSIVFPDVRAKGVLEIRAMDSVKPTYGMGAAALIKGLFYNRDNLERLSALFTPMTTQWVERGKCSGRDHGLQGYYHSDYFVNWGLGLLRMAREALSSDEAALLDPLEALWNNLDTPATELGRLVDRVGWQEAWNSIEVRHVLS